VLVPRQRSSGRWALVRLTRSAGDSASHAPPLGVWVAAHGSRECQTGASHRTHPQTRRLGLDARSLGSRSRSLFVVSAGDAAGPDGTGTSSTSSVCPGGGAAACVPHDEWSAPTGWGSACDRTACSAAQAAPSGADGAATTSSPSPSVTGSGGAEPPPMVTQGFWPDHREELEESGDIVGQRDVVYGGHLLLRMGPAAWDSTRRVW
jgi:hypothetical protein